LFINVVIVKVQHHNPGVAMQNPIRSRKLIYALGAAAGFLIATAWVLYAVFTSTSSTAPIGLILIPIYGVMAALIGCAVVYVGFVAVDVIAGRLNWGSVRVLTASAFVAVAVLFGGAVFLYRDALAIAENPQSPPAELMAVSQRWIPLWRMEVFLALAKNPATPGVLLTAMSEQKESPALVSMIGANPGTPVATLEKIVAGSRSYERVAGVAENPQITPAIAERLAKVGRMDFRDDLDYKLYQTFVLAALARNPVTPQPVFERLATWDKPEYFLAVAVIYAERATCAQIARAGETGGENAVLRSTAQSQLKRRGC
jgi:hypothetical protein